MKNQKIKWPQNSDKMFQEFQSEFWWQALASNHSNDFWDLEELDDHGILVKFFKDLITSRIRWLRNSYEILQEFSSRIPVASLSIQQFRWLLNSSKARWPQNSYKIILGFWSEFCWFILKMTNLRIRKLDDHGILMKF